MRWLATLAVAGGAGAAAAQVQVTPSPDQPVVTLAVQESAQVLPDVATVSAGVETVAPGAGTALADNAARMARVMDAIRAAGVPAREVRTGAVTLNSRYNYQAGARTFDGYAASNSVTVVLRDVAAIGPFLDRLAGAGATQLNGPSFAVEHPEPLRVAARDRAVARANEEAQAYARRAGFRIARLLSLTEQAGFTQPTDQLLLARVAPPAPPPPRVSTEVAGGTLSVGIAITATYRLER